MSRDWEAEDNESRTPLLIDDDSPRVEITSSSNTSSPDKTPQVKFTKHEGRNTNIQESSTGRYDLLLSGPPVLSFSQDHSKESKCRLYCGIASFTVVCTALIIILLLTYELQINCPAGGSLEITARKRSLDNSLKFLLASDMHFDSYYNDEISPASTFCRKLGNFTPANNYHAPYGRVGCDSPEPLIDSWLSEMKKVHDKERVEFILITGDLSAHNTGAGYFRNGLTRERVLTNIRTTLDKIHRAFPGIPVFPVLGNNDFAAHNTLPDNDVDRWYQDTLAVFAPMILCSGCLSSQPKPTTMEELDRTFLDGGYYKASIADGRLVVLALNSMYWYVHANVNSPYIQNKAMAQMKWLEQQLLQAERQGKKVILTSHVPPGMDTYDEESLWLADYTRRYTDLVVGRYNDVVAGQIYGHLHKDDFQLQILDARSPAKSNEDRQTPIGHTRTPSHDTQTPSHDTQTHINKSFVLLVPSLSVVYANNPSFRLVYLDPVKQVLLDYDQYYMDIVMATEFSSPDWQFDYRFSQRYPSSRSYIDGERIYELNHNLINRTSKQPWINYAFSRAVNYQISGYSRFKLYCCMRYVNATGYKKCVMKYNVLGG